jgi:hypothetical protein
MILKQLPERLDKIVLPLMSLTNKLVLGGSTALYMIGAMKREPQDLDISLKERLTHSELSHIIDFFNLNYELTSDDYKFEEDDFGGGNMIATEPTVETVLNRDLIQLYHMKDDSVDYKIDIFNQKIVGKSNIMTVEYQGASLNMVHPSYSIAAKAKYAFDPRIKASYKHIADLKQIMEEDNLKQYYKTVNELSKKPDVSIEL